MTETFDLKINGRMHAVTAEPETPLLYILRNDIALNGAKFGCGLGQCGACTVIVGGTAARSCVMPVAKVGGEEITTIEGLGTLGQPHPLQKAFMAEQAAQCGYCINGMIMTAKAFLAQQPDPTDEQIRDGLAQNLCRCGTHNRIVRAIQAAAKEMKA
jgi:nicotinate dehydrogenase subunit A